MKRYGTYDDTNVLDLSHYLIKLLLPFAKKIVINKHALVKASLGIIRLYLLTKRGIYKCCGSSIVSKIILRGRYVKLRR